MNTEFNQSEKQLLVLYYALQEDFQRKVKSIPTAGEGWDPIQEIPYKMVWDAVTQVLTESGKFGPVPWGMIQAKLLAAPNASDIFARVTPITQEIQTLVTVIANHDVPKMATHVKSVLGLFQRFLDVRIALASVTKMTDASVTDISQGLRTSLQAVRMNTVKRTDFMHPDAELPDLRFVRIPFGIPWFDDMCAGGMAEGDAMLFIAPSGSGKTLWGTQLSWFRAKTAQHVCYLTYEQGIAGDIMVRFLAMATGMSKDKFENVKMSDLGPAVIESFNLARMAAGRYMHTYNMAEGDQGAGGIPEIKQIIDAETQMGCRPSLIVVDWVETAVRRCMAAKGIDADSLTTQMDQFANEFALMCRDEKIQGVLLQQMETASQAKHNIEPHHTLAGRCKSMGNYCRFAFGVARFQNDLGTMVRTKATTVGSNNMSKATIEMRGDLNQFIFRPDIVHDEKSGKFVTPNAMSMNV